jgi:hypothetical protein
MLMTFSTMDFFATFGRDESQNNDGQHKHSVIMLSLDFYYDADRPFAVCYYAQCHATFLKAFLQGTLTERKGSVLLTTLYQQV